jgi:ATP-dependent DNA helicase RecG
MPTKAEIEALLDKLEDGPADDLEGQLLDFMEWSEDRYAQPKKVLLEKVICMANGGGGTVVVGVRDRVKTRKRAILGVPSSVDMSGLKRSIQSATRPTITMTFERLPVPEGHGRLFVVQIVGGAGPYTDAQGAAKIRQDKDCNPFDGAMIRDHVAASGAADFTGTEVDGALEDLISAAGVERLKAIAREQESPAPADLLRRATPEFLRSLNLISSRGKLKKAGLLLVGQSDRIAEHFWRRLHRYSARSH